MSKPTLRVLLVLLAFLLAYGIWFGSKITLGLFRSICEGSDVQPEVIMPVLTRFAVNRCWILILAVSVFALGGLLLSAFRTPAALIGAVGIAMPLLVGWFSVFSLSFANFLGLVSMAHPQRFDPAALVFSFGGFFPISLALIVFLARLFVRDASRELRRSRANSQASVRTPQV
ncbi:MAG: hypothetical protein H7A46_22785 [Verrucomicrobiales bacterium]|nr:hypothetical protein [Planctomycetota bacterium]MCP5524369.1 hypothetical protein [Verrucomicrobiales bacterium]